jgi:peptidoglycan-associated lipoprotein
LVYAQRHWSQIELNKGEIMTKLALAIASALILSACSSTKETVKPETDVKPSTSTGAPSSSSTSGTSSTSTSGTSIPNTPPTGTIPAKRSVYFDFDSNAIKDEFTPVVQAHAKFLTDNRNRRIRVEGNTDERGSREYNLALGQRRADSVKRSLAVLGVPEARIESVSFGEEKAVAPGHDESAWQQNRRADLKYDGEK